MAGSPRKTRSHPVTLGEGAQGFRQFGDREAGVGVWVEAAGHDLAGGRRHPPVDPDRGGPARDLPLVFEVVVGAGTYAQIRLPLRG